MKVKNEAGETTIIYRQGDSTIEIDIQTIVQKRISKYDTIIEYARKEADIMIMATHGRRGIPHIVFDSVAEEVAQGLKLPVITVKMDFNESD